MKGIYVENCNTLMNVTENTSNGKYTNSHGLEELILKWSWVQNLSHGFKDASVSINHSMWYTALTNWIIILLSSQ